MNVKRWFAWVCLALMIVTEIFLFRANHERDDALTKLHDAQQQLHDAQAQLDTLSTSNAAAQVSELASLRKQNEALTTKNSALQKNMEAMQLKVNTLVAEQNQTREHLDTARTALQLQQQNLQQLQNAQQQALAVANANACINNLRQIDAAKNQWALEKNKSANDVPTVQDIAPYLKDNTLPVCPEAGTYSLNAAGVSPTCTIPGHVLPQ